MMKTWFPKGMTVLSGDDLYLAKELRKMECRISIHEAAEILLDQIGEDLELAKAAWTGEIRFSYEGEHQQRKLSNDPADLPKPSDVLKHIEICGTELNRWLQEKHPWAVFRFPEKPGQAHEPEATANKPTHPAPTSVLIEPASVGLSMRSVAVNTEWVMKKAALIAKHRNQWQSIDRDFQDASENGLSKIAKAPGHGNWFEGKALEWAEQRGKRTKVGDQITPLPATPFTGLTHKMPH